jgi:hypothetical protein
MPPVSDGSVRNAMLTNFRPVFSLRLPKWYNTKVGIPETEISLLLVLYDTVEEIGERSIGVTFGLSQKTFTDALNFPPKRGGNIHPLILIISLLQYVDKYVDSAISDGTKQLEKIREDLVDIQQFGKAQ